MEILADVADFYGGAALGAGLSPDEEIGLWGNIPRLRAARQLWEVQLHGMRLEPDSLYDLTLLATGSRRAAEAAHYEATKRLLKEQNPV